MGHDRGWGLFSLDCKFEPPAFRRVQEAENISTPICRMDGHDKYMNLPVDEMICIIQSMANEDEVKAKDLLTAYNEHRKAQESGRPVWARNVEVWKGLRDEKGKQLVDTREAITELTRKMRIEADRVSMIDTSGNDVSLAKWEEQLEAHDIDANAKIASQDQLFDRIDFHFREDKQKIVDMYQRRIDTEQEDYERTVEQLRRKLRIAEEQHEQFVAETTLKREDKLEKLQNTVAVKRENLTLQVDGMRRNLLTKRKHLEGMVAAAQIRVQKAMEQESPALLRLKAELNDLKHTEKELEDWLQQK